MGGLVEGIHPLGLRGGYQPRQVPVAARGWCGGLSGSLVVGFAHEDRIPDSDGSGEAKVVQEAQLESSCAEPNDEDAKEQIAVKFGMIRLTEWVRRL